MEKVKDMNNDWKIKYPGKNIYVMRDHNWSFSAWEIGRLNHEVASETKLLHVDFHDDFLEPTSDIDVSNIRSEKEALDIASQFEIFEFIKPSIRTGTIGEVYMVGDYDRPPTGVHHSYTFNQFENEYRKCFFTNDEKHSYILDLDLDFFDTNCHRFSEGKYDGSPHHYSETYIKNQLAALKNYTDWDLITVCISPEYCGGDEGGQYLLDMFIEVFELEEEKFIYW